MQKDLFPETLWRPDWLYEIPARSRAIGYRFVNIPDLVKLAWKAIGSAGGMAGASVAYDEIAYMMDGYG